MPPSPRASIVLQPTRHPPERADLPTSPVDELIQLGWGRTPGGYAYESAASMIVSLAPAARPAAADHPPHPMASAAEQQAYVLSSRLQTLDRLLADVGPDVDDQEMRLLRTLAARVGSELVVAYDHGEPHRDVHTNGRGPDRRSAA